MSVSVWVVVGECLSVCVCVTGAIKAPRVLPGQVRGER